MSCPCIRSYDGKENFVRENWSELAYRAYRGYREKGKMRGAIVVRVRGRDAEIGEYVSRQDPLALSHADVHRSMFEYDPDRAVVCVFRYKGGKRHTPYRCQTPCGKKTPRKVYYERMAEEHGHPGCAEGYAILDALEEGQLHVRHCS